MKMKITFYVAELMCGVCRMQIGTIPSVWTVPINVYALMS